MEKDFSIKGREKYLSSVYHDTHFKFEKSEAIFARQTLLQRIIWQAKPDNTFCHLDGYDSDVIHHYNHGVLLIGRAWLLNKNEYGNQVYTAMAIEFDEVTQAVKNGRFWVSTMPVIRGNAPPDFVIPSFLRLFSGTGALGKNWEVAFMRKAVGWTCNPLFNLSIFLGLNTD